MNITYLKNTTAPIFQSKTARSSNAGSEPSDGVQNDNAGRNMLIGTMLALASMTFHPSELKSSPDTYTQNPIEIVDDKTPKAAEAKNMGLAPTANGNVYYDEENKVYYLWDNKKQEFKKNKEISSVFKTGYMKTKKGSYLDKNGNMFVENMHGKYLWPKQDIGYNLAYEMAKVYGYERTPISELSVFYDKENKKYVSWSKEDNAFKNSAVTDVANGGYYIENEKAYRMLYQGREEVPVETFYANKNGLNKYGKNLYYKNDYSYNTHYYKWDNDSKTFSEFGYAVDFKKMQASKADGKIDNFIQGNIGDCWLLSTINGLKKSEKGRKLLEKSLKIDDDNNITVTLQGPKKTYKITGEEMDSIMKDRNYHYSIGDKDVVAIEIAFERFRQEIAESSPHFRVSNMYNYYHRPQFDGDMALEGGHNYNALHVLTGMESDRVYSPDIDNVLIHNDTAILGKLDEERVKSILDNKNNLVFASYKTDNQDDGHAVVLDSIDDKYVYITDSNIRDDDSDRIVKSKPVKKEEFFKDLFEIVYTDLSTPVSEKKAKPYRSTLKTTPQTEKYFEGTVYL